ncbi:zinc ABC transporter substrate-binding protein [Thermoplasmatales archaeon ex4572_165]|nr:MAG: zinc ABC transporter substrate-binding protein [Thermoplasmatales archaeon ex4572_165]RLF58393.1 MAG: zinc ABC transporter substrate-binding protein [Thermoplasmata archaeon]
MIKIRKLHIKKLSLFTVILFIVLAMNGCIDSNISSDKINVLVTIIPQKEMVDAIGGQLVSITTLVPEGQSPHSYEPTPSQMIKVSKSKAYFIVGSGVEFEIVHMNTILEQNDDLVVFDCSKDIDVVSLDEHYRQDHYDESGVQHDPDHAGIDSHIWTSPLNYKKMAEVVYNGLIEIDPENQEEYHFNYEGYVSELDALHNNISNMLQPYAGKSFMAYHPAWGYFSDTYNLKQISIEDNGKQPGPAGVAAVIEQAKNELIKVIFVAPQFDVASAETIAEEIGGRVVFADPLMSNYQEAMYSLASEMLTGFQGQTP